MNCRNGNLIRDEPNSSIFPLLLRRCGDLRLVAEGRLLHAQIARRGHDNETFIGNLLVQMYGKCGSIEDAAAAFEKISRKNVFSWNLLIAAFVHNGELLKAWQAFEKAPQKDAVSWTTMLMAYAKNGFTSNARSLFDAMPVRDLVSWNAMIAAYSQNGEGHEAIDLYRRMNLEGLKPEDLTIISVLDACTVISSLKHAKSIHDSLRCHSDLVNRLKVCNALINLYGKFKCLAEAGKIFEGMNEKDVISWTAMSAAFNQSGDSKQALKIFRTMELEGIKATSVTLIEVLNACGNTGSAAEGRKLHQRSIATGWFAEELNVQNALLNMYGKCGDLNEARALFEKMRGRDLVTWNAMLASYAQNGVGIEALKLFEFMGLEGIQPDGITVVCMISACSHAGLIGYGLRCISSIYADYGVESTTEQLNCVVDLLGRLGSVVEARNVMAAEATADDEVGMRTVLGACKLHGDVAAVDPVAERTTTAPVYVMLSNIFAENV